MERGYTLVELCVVILILGIVLMVAIPRLVPFLTGSRLETAARELAAFCRYLNAQAVLTKLHHTLNIDIGEGEYWVTTIAETEEATFFPDSQDLQDVEIDTDLLRRRKLPEGVRFEDVLLSVSGGNDRGIVEVDFTPLGPTEKIFVHLTGDTGRKNTVFFDPMTGESGLLDGHVQVLDESSLGLGSALWGGEGPAPAY
jgi:prepilin-type N-terminal cleavage/methylation domain-containing protein